MIMKNTLGIEYTTGGSFILTTLKPTGCDSVEVYVANLSQGALVRPGISGSLSVEIQLSQSLTLQPAAQVCEVTMATRLRETQEVSLCLFINLFLTLFDSH